MKCDIRDRRVDGGYGWIVVLSSFFLIVITDGIFFSFGNLLIELTGAFDEERATTAVISSISMGVACLFGPVGSSICNKYGCRIVAVFGAVTSCMGLIISTFASSVFYLYVSYGFVGGVGLGCMYLSANVIVMQHFNRYRGLACGIALCGSGAGTFLFNLITRFLLNFYGWRGTILIEAGMCLQGVVFGLLLLPPVTITEQTSEQYKPNNTVRFVDADKKDKTTSECTAKETKGSRKIRNKIKKSKLFQRFIYVTLLTDRRLWAFLLSTFVVHLAFSVVIGFTADYAVESGMSKYEASWLASSIGIANTVSRIFLGWIADRKGVCRIVMMCVLLLLAGMSTALSFLLTTFPTRMLNSSLYGFFIGGYIIVCPLVLMDLFSGAAIAKLFGMYLFAIGIATTIATPIGGLLFDKTKSYDVTYVVAGCELIIGGILALTLKFMKKRKDIPANEPHE